MMVKQATMGMRAHTPLAMMSLTAEQQMRIPVHRFEGEERVLSGDKRDVED